jgi:hypothetical protein
MELNKIQSTGNWGKAADDLNQNFTKVNTAVEQIKNATTRNKGYFPSEEALNEAFPSANVGDIAYVGSEYPYQTWAWNGTIWEKKNDAGGEDSVNLGDYYTKAETDEKFTEADAKLSELGSNEALFYPYEYGAIDFSTGENIDNTIRLRTKPIKINGTGKKVFCLKSPSNISIRYDSNRAKYAVHGYLQGVYIGALSVIRQNNGFELNCDGTFDEIIVSLRKGGEEITEEEKNNCYSWWQSENESQSTIIETIGDDNNYIKGNFHSIVKGGNTYRIWLCNPDIDMSGVTVQGNYDRFSVGLKDDEGNTSVIVKVLVGEKLNHFYDFTIPSTKPYYNIRTNIRATKGEVLRCIIEDITISGSNAKNLEKTPYIGGSSYDFSIKDENGNIVLAVDEGHIRTKRFNSKEQQNGNGQLFEGYQRQTRFTVDVQTAQPQKTSFGAKDINSNVESNIVSDYAVLYLPNDYTPTGKPTKLIVFCKQGGTLIDDDEDPIFSINIFNYMLYLGYAILGVDGVPDGLVSSIGLDNERVTGNYVAVQATKTAYDYVIKKYNIDRNGAFVFGYSQGGHYAQNVVDLSGIPVLACAELSPVCSMRYHQWDLAVTRTINGTQFTKSARLNIARMFGFPTVQTNSELLALEYNQDLVQGYDPWTRNVENPYTGFVYGTSVGSTLWGLPSGVSIDDITMKKYLKAPLKIWCADSDTILGADIMKVFIKACKNAGQACDIEVYSSGSHWIYREQDSIGTFVENGITYNLYPLAKSIAVWFNSYGGCTIK